ncbi:MAG: SpoIIE family protein phosphatase [Christensenellales bacterium]|jgi:hypothetical protein
MANDLCTETGYVSYNKAGEELCGDKLEVYQDEKITLMVLADGLGSGVKANILSTLTSKILVTMIAGGMPIDECIDTIASTLPVCKVRGVAYSTFTVIVIREMRHAELIQYDNPAIIMLRGGARWDYPVSTRSVAGKTIHESKFPVREGDLLIAMSDGAPFAGVGVTRNFGWQRENIIDFAEANYLPENSAKHTAAVIGEACNQLYEYRPGDDTTVAALRIRKRSAVNLVIGPPADKAQDVKMMNLFFAKDGEKVVCGGTTASIAAKYLGREIEPTLDYPDPDIPPVSCIAGVDLVTEGVITISRVLQIGEAILGGGAAQTAWTHQSDGASQVARKLFDEATDINFFVGRAINPAHQNPDLPITFGIKIQLIEALEKCLAKMGKRIKVSYF